MTEPTQEPAKPTPRAKVNISHNPPCKCGSVNVSNITNPGIRAYVRYLCGEKGCRHTWVVWKGKTA